MKPFILQNIQVGPQEHSDRWQLSGHLLTFLVLFQRSDLYYFQGWWTAFQNLMEAIFHQLTWLTTSKLSGLIQ